jgi:hypothetical protein
MHALARDQVTHRALVVERGEDRRLGPRSCDVREYALGASALV